MARRRRRTRPKYILRRIMLVLVALGVIGVLIWFLAGKLKPSQNDGVATPASTAPDSASPLEFDSEPERVAPTNMNSSASGAEGEGSPALPPNSEIDGEPGEKAPAQTGDWALLLVNATNFLPENYEDTLDLETITENYSVDARIADNVKQMFVQAKADGINLTICSAYRSVELQQTLFDQKTQEYVTGGQDEKTAMASASAIVAKPGTSEHHTGLAMDIVTSSYRELDEGFENTPAFGWLSENAHKYGFVLRFPKNKFGVTKIIYEPWHYRFVGEENAAIMKARGLCLEEYVDELQKQRSNAALAVKNAENSEDAASGGDSVSSEPDDGASSPAA